MKQAEFLDVYKDLAEHFGQNAFSVMRGKLLFEVVKEMPQKWWRDIANRMIRSNDSRFDIESAVRSELQSQSNQRRAREEIDALDNLRNQITDEGFQDALKKMGAKSLWDAIDKARSRRFG